MRSTQQDPHKTEDESLTLMKIVIWLAVAIALLTALAFAGLGAFARFYPESPQPGATHAAPAP